MLKDEECASAFAGYVQSVFDTYREPLLKFRDVKRLIRAVPLQVLLNNFTRVDKNILVIGMRNLTLAFTHGSKG